MRTDETDCYGVAADDGPDRADDCVRSRSSVDAAVSGHRLFARPAATGDYPGRVSFVTVKPF